jgi:hypothetical protein
MRLGLPFGLPFGVSGWVSRGRSGLSMAVKDR